MKIVICDGSRKRAEETAELFKKHVLRGRDTLRICESCDQLVRDMEKEPQDVIVMDTCVNGSDGLAAAARIREQHSRALILFLSDTPEHAIKAFQVEAFRFLEKPLMPGAADVLWDEIEEAYLNSPKRFAYRRDGCLNACGISEIAYILSNGNFIDIRLVCGSTTDFVSMSLKEALRRLSDDGFVQISRGCVVNLLHVRVCGAGEVVLADGETLPVKTSFKKDVMLAFKQYCDRRNYS